MWNGLIAFVRLLQLPRAVAVAAVLAQQCWCANSVAANGTPEPDSPRLRALAGALRGPDPKALDQFWSEPAVTHTPLIEAIEGRPRDALYTFIWRAQPGQVALNVLFNGWFALHKPTGFDSFTRLGESNVWYTSYVLPRDAHLRYELIAPKGWHASTDRATYFTMDGMEYETFHDPLNTRLIEWNQSIVSYAEGPDAKTSPYLAKRTQSAAGRMETLQVHSDAAGSSRSVQVYLPAGYGQSARDYGLLLAFDGNQYTGAVPTPRILDNMIADGTIAPVVAVFLESPNRDVEFPPNDAFQNFIARELIPQLRRHYRLNRDPRRSAVLGSSYGGLAATYTALSHPELFGNVISQSGSYGWSPTPAEPGAPPRGVGPESGWLIKRVAQTPRRNVRFYLDAGVWEGNMMLFSNRLLQAILVGKGYDSVYVERDGTHSSFYWMLRLPDGLRVALGTHTPPR